MIIIKSDIVAKIRTAIDDVTPSASDSFTTNTDNELWQAAQHAVQSLLEELPFDMLEVHVEQRAGTVDSSRGFAYAKVDGDDYDFLRFVSIDIAGTASILNELIEPGSDLEKMQRSPWSRGSVTKPKAMLDFDEKGNQVIVWWPGDDTHNSAQLTYIAKPDVVTVATEEITSVPAIDCDIKDIAERMVIYRAASIFFEGKKETALAEQYKNI
jgi:hypothetical protein